MKNTFRWRSDRLDGAVVRRFLGTLWSNKSVANVEDSDCTVRMFYTSQLDCLSFVILLDGKATGQDLVKTQLCGYRQEVQRGADKRLYMKYRHQSIIAPNPRSNKQMVRRVTNELSPDKILTKHSFVHIEKYIHIAEQCRLKCVHEILTSERHSKIGTPTVHMYYSMY
jgi:hypothetical protein